MGIVKVRGSVLPDGRESGRMTDVRLVLASRRSHCKKRVSRMDGSREDIVFDSDRRGRTQRINDSP